MFELLIPALTSIFGEKMKQDSQREANIQNINMQGMAWQRDDAQVQRRVKDLVAAGLHPTLAAGGGSTSQPARVEPLIQNNMFDQAQQSAQRQLDMTMSKTQQELVKQQVARETAATSTQQNQSELVKQQARIEKQKADIFESTGVLPGQEPGFMGVKVPAGWMKDVKDKAEKMRNKKYNPEKPFGDW